MTIRQETEKDFNSVYNLVKDAFATAEHSDGKEHELVNKLRKSEAFVPKLSLVALDGDKIVGHILFTKIKLGKYKALALAPLAVAPDYQSKGIGGELIRQGHKIAADMGYEFSVVLGSDKYYPKFGYIKASDVDIKAPFEVPDENFMAIYLQGDKFPNVGETVGYAEEFFS